MQMPRLVFGTATLFREPRVRARASVLEAALAGGISEFDTAPIYGLGRAERELGAFLRSNANGVTARVSTKFGRAAPGANPVIRLLQPALRSAVRRLPRVQTLARSSALAQTHTVALRYRDLAQGIEASQLIFGTMLRRVVAHDPPPYDSWFAAVTDLQGDFPFLDVGVSCAPTDCGAWLAQLAQGNATTINVDARSALRFADAIASNPATTYIHSAIRVAEEFAWLASPIGAGLAEDELRQLDVMASQSRRISFGLACLQVVHPAARIVIGSSNSVHVSELLATIHDFAAYWDSRGPESTRRLTAFAHKARRRIVASH